MFLTCIVASVASCSKERDGQDAEDAALESFFKSYADTCFVNYDGIYLYVMEKGSEEYSEGETVTIVSTGKTLENIVTFSSGSILQTTYPGSDLIEGWKIALKHLKKGDKGILVVPFKYGFGKKRTGQIEPYSTLVYAFEMM